MLFFLTVQQLSQSTDFFIFLLSHLFNPSSYNILNSLFFMNNFLKLTDLLLIMVFLLCSFPFSCLNFSLHHTFIPFFCFLYVCNTIFFCLLILVLPFFDLVMKLYFFTRPIITFSLLFLDLYFHKFILRSHITVLFFSFL